MVDIRKKMARLKFYLASCPDKTHGYVEHIDEAVEHIDELTKQLAQHEEVALILRGFQQAYPLDIFPEIEDWKGVNYFMEQAGLSLSRVSASNMRHVIKCITEALPQQNDTRS